MNTHEAELLTASGQRIAKIAFEDHGSSVDIIGKLRFDESAANSGEATLLLQLARGSDDLALAVMADIERQLVELGLMLKCQSSARTLKLGEDFRGLVIAEGGGQIAFELSRSNE